MQPHGTVQLCFDHEGEPKYGEYGTVPAHQTKPNPDDWKIYQALSTIEEEDQPEKELDSET